MDENKKPTLAHIKRAVARHRGIPVKEMMVSGSSKRHAHERRLVISLAFRLGHKGDEIAKVLGYKNANNLSTIFEGTLREEKSTKSCFKSDLGAIEEELGISIDNGP
ncbi:MAG: hypothetical protein H6861_01585 [Rhodospirillales bacterium]|nr:hypothetical protein [Rhodospirillales bacterium]